MSSKLWRDSASLIILARKKILHNEGANFKVLLFNRSEKTSFMPNHAVFPGGVAESADESIEWLKHFQKLGVNDAKLKDLTKVQGPRPPIFQTCKPDALAREISLRITAIRETFEEVGVLLCKPRDQITADFVTYGQVIEDFDRESWQKAVHNDPAEFLKLCKKLDVMPDLWSIHEWAVWMTPAAFKKRFATAFYIVALNDIPNVLLEENEVGLCSWETPQNFLKQYRNQTVWLPPPQRYELSRLCQIEDIEMMLQFARKRAIKGSTLLLPIQYQCTDGQIGTLPGDDFYSNFPNECSQIIEIDESIEEFNNKAEKLHRFVYTAPHSSKLVLTIDQLNGHLKPIEEHLSDETEEATSKL